MWPRAIRTATTGRGIGTTPEATLDAALRTMAQAGVRHLPVIAERPGVGLLTQAANHSWGGAALRSLLARTAAWVRRSICSLASTLET
ncbi:hypothetical protein Actkin_02234 [Actinokineospora sp. UTMC 2448]|nr:hypothetical protein Actkin_02234 [Actinokineospora sp. UTMC 2448]